MEVVSEAVDLLDSKAKCLGRVIDEGYSSDKDLVSFVAGFLRYGAIQGRTGGPRCRDILKARYINTGWDYLDRDTIPAGLLVEFMFQSEFDDHPRARYI